MLFRLILLAVIVVFILYQFNYISIEEINNYIGKIINTINIFLDELKNEINKLVSYWCVIM